MTYRRLLIVSLTLLAIGLVYKFLVHKSIETPLPVSENAPIVEETPVQTSRDAVVPVVTEESTTPSTVEVPVQETTKEKVLPTYTKDTLATYNGENPGLPIYIAFEGNVYDVTAGKEYYEPGGVYHFLAGTDGTPLLKTIGGDIIKRKYPVVGVYRENN